MATLELGNSESLGVGDPIRAVGARFENRNALSVLNAGEVTGLGVSVPGVAREVTLIETNALIERGDSGGPLLNAAGEVVGVVVARGNDADGAGGDSRSFAIPLVLGSQVQTLIAAAESDAFDMGFVAAYSPGYIFVINLDPEGEGARQGLRDYDQILAIDGQRIPIPDPGETVANRIYLRFRQRPPGTEIDLLISRANEDGARRSELVVRFVMPDRSRVP